MANEIQAIHSASSAMTITLASLATSTAGVGRQTTMVNNTSTYQMIRVYFKVTTGTSPTANKTIQFYLLTGDAASPNLSTDNAGASDAGLTVVTAPMVFVVQTDATSNNTYYGSFLMRNPGPLWGLAIVHDTAVNLNATGSNHSIRYVGENVNVV